MSVPASVAGFDQLPDSANVRAPTVAALAGCSVRSVWRLAKAGMLPAPRKIGPKLTAWRVGDIRAFLASR